MTEYDGVHQYLKLDAKSLAPFDAMRALTVADLDKPLWTLLSRHAREGFSKSDYELTSLPVAPFQRGTLEVPLPSSERLQNLAGVFSPSPDAAHRLRQAVRAVIASGNTQIEHIAINPAMSTAEYSIPVAPDATMFGTIDDARRLIAADQLPDSLDGTGVNVVVIDAGIDSAMLPPAQFGGGWPCVPQGPGLPTPLPPGMTTGESALHGMMIVNNILALAPKATIWDVPLIPPPKIYDIRSFLIAAHTVFAQILTDILAWQKAGVRTGPWIFMNAWAIFDRRSEAPHLGEYTENRGTGGVPPHLFIKTIEDVANAGFDLVFCAGNCGEVCPDGRCGPNDYGPGRGIWGANAHEQVLTAGAVRVDGIWAGYSSEGPGPTPNLYERKPDFCAPSQFVGLDGKYPLNDGTSAAAAITAGVVSALRTEAGANWSQTKVPPDKLRQILNNTATPLQGGGWNRWLGNGVLNAGAAYQQLLAEFP
jgi:hypothetical protein